MSRFDADWKAPLCCRLGLARRLASTSLTGKQTNKLLFTSHKISLPITRTLEAFEMAANVMPNPAVIAQEMQNLQQSTANLGSEFALIGNLPAFNGIQALQQQITGLGLAIQNGFQQTTQQHAAVMARFQLMDVKATARYQPHRSSP
jgi:hypothetical protein